jgi:hypothetical protein
VDVFTEYSVIRFDECTRLALTTKIKQHTDLSVIVETRALPVVLLAVHRLDKVLN